MKKAIPFGVAIICSLLTLVAAFAKGNGPGIYAVVDQVTFEQPNVVRIYGVFAVPVWHSSGSYQPAQKGYLYFQIPSGAEPADRKELEQIESFAGTGKVIGFSSYWVVANPNDPFGILHHSLEVAVRVAGNTATPDIYPEPLLDVAKAGDQDFDLKVAEKLQN